MRIIAFIPARSGSTRLKNKNIKLLKSRPLIYWTVRRAIELKIFNEIIFSSDSKSYFNVLLKYLKIDKLDTSKIIFDHRNMSHSKVKSKIFDYIKNDLIKKFKMCGSDLIVQLLPTAPLRTKTSIKAAINLAKRTKKNIFSVSKYDFHISFALLLLKKKSMETIV